MSTPTAPGNVYQVPTLRPPFNSLDAVEQKNSYNVAVQIMPGLSGPVHPCQMDTGSCGIVIPIELLYVNGDTTGHTWPGIQMDGPVQVAYAPSGNLFNGFSFIVPQVGVGIREDGTPAFVAENVRVAGMIGVPAGEGMMGVGFGRPNVYGTNVLLAAPGANPSFLLTTDGIWVGHTAATLPNAGSFGFQQLVADSTVTAGWKTPAATITVAGTNYPGTALLDTGVNLMMLGIGQTDWAGQLIGESITITWPGSGAGATPILSYSFKVIGLEPPPTPGTESTAFEVGGDSPMRPSSLKPLNSSAAPFVNTGINVIQGAAYFFDANVGQIGFSTAGK